MKLKYLFIPAVMFCLSNTSLAATPAGNGTWAYDSVYNSHSDFKAPKGGKIKPGLFASQIQDYNNAAQGKHKLTEIFSYGGDMEMYCKGAGGSSRKTPCVFGPGKLIENQNAFVYYSPGQQSTAAYANKIKDVTIVPIVDGRLDNKGEDDLLSPFNQLNNKEASAYADEVAQLYCADDRVAGVQFDIEPFDITQLGQTYFYQEIAKDFAGKNIDENGIDKFSCVDKAYPQGRFFSVFTFAKMVNATVASIFNEYQNGYIIDSLYDLGPNPGGIANSPAQYQGYVDQEVKDMLKAANTYNIHYQFAIPGAASAHEFESKSGIATGYKQLDYITDALQAIEINGARNDKYFLGINLWSWNQKMFWRGDVYTPAKPPQEVLNYLAGNL